MADAHLFGGEKGGAGKSFVCRAACDYLLSREQPFTLFEADRSNPDCKRIYGRVVPCKLAIFSEGQQYEDAANRFYELAINKRVLVNLPAQVLPALRRWVEENDILALAGEDGVIFHHWFISNGSWDSLNLFRKYVVLFPDMQHYFVKNLGVAEDFSGFEEDEELLKLVKRQKIPVLEFPRFHGAATRNRIDASSLAFGEAAMGKGMRSSIDRRRVKTFLGRVDTFFSQSGAFADD